MNAEQFKVLVKQVKVAKSLPDAVYFHKDSFSEIPLALAKFIQIVAQALKISEEEWDLVKLFKNDFRLSLLSYPTFFEDPYPALNQSVTIDLVKLSHRITKYDNHSNPPILHRKETMIPETHCSYSEFCAITEEAERAGLFENTRIIGFKHSWERLIEQKGYKLINGRLFVSSKQNSVSAEKNIDRHKTALVRHELSAPMKSLAKHGYLSGDYSIFDYGCGRGDDLRELEAHGIDAIGWDPNYRPDTDRVSSQVVNIGFVINVIEDRDERIDALLKAWELTESLLVVSAMLANEAYLAQFSPYKDGVITARNTFQKYYTQAELKEFIETIVDELAIAVAPGIYFVFRDKQEEQAFLQNRHKRAYKWQHLTAPEPANTQQARILFVQHKALFENFWLSCLAYGRIPATDEFSQSNEIKEVIGSNKKAFKLVINWFNVEELYSAEKMRMEDLLVYFALSLFGKRKPYTQQPEDLKRDIKAFFGTFKVAEKQATDLLFQISDVDAIKQQCLIAEQSLPASKLTYENEVLHALTLHKQYIEDLPSLLRIYVGAALQLYGELDDIQLIKIHATSGKVTLLGYEDFDNDPTPKLKERVKIKMAEQDVDFFDYVNSVKLTRLENKVDFIPTL